MVEKKSVDKFTRRFYILNICVTVVLLASILISIETFGEDTWQYKKQIAMILPGKKDDLGWNKSQYVAMKNVCDEMETELIIYENVSDNYYSCKSVIEKILKRNVGTIYFANGLKLSDMNRVRDLSPKLMLCTVESISILWHDGRYRILAFEASYIAGILAGLRTKTNKIGYIVPYQESEINSCINAFTVGVHSVNPNAEVLLYWTGSWNNPKKEEQAVQILKAEHADILTYHQNGDTIPNSAKTAGIYFISFNQSYPKNEYCLGSIEIDWANIYRNLFKHRENVMDKNLNATFGLITGNTVDFRPSSFATMREKVAVDSLKWEIKHGRMIFAGDIFDINGVKRCSAGETMSLNVLYTKNTWLIKGVRTVGN